MLERGATDGKMKKTEGRRISSEGVVGNAVGTWIRLRRRKEGCVTGESIKAVVKTTCCWPTEEFPFRQYFSKY